MHSPRFVHLRMHSEYSISDGIVRLEAAVAKAAADQQPALAITDLGNTFAYIKFYKSARAAGVKPLLGADVWITNDSDRDRPHRLLLLVQNTRAIAICASCCHGPGLKMPIVIAASCVANGFVKPARFATPRERIRADPKARHRQRLVMG